jgi:aryl-alcohol dehydrogenase-like predicted oxidoreductase
LRDCTAESRFRGSANFSEKTITRANPSMRYRIFGERTGLRVSELALGAGNFGTAWGVGADRAEARRIFDAYRAAGGNFLDTSDFYHLGEAEETVADLIATDRDDLVLATKFGLGSPQFGGLAATGNSRKAMRRAVEASLRRLRTDHIDLYWAHMPDGVTPIDEILRGFDDLVRAGKILYAGLSNFPAWRVSRGALLADVRGWAPVVGIQVEYNLADRSIERELLPMADALGLGCALWSPLSAGFLTGRHRISAEGVRKSVRAITRSEKSPRDTAIIDALFAIGTESGTTPTHVAIAWLRAKARSAASTRIPILGPRTLEQLQPALEALNLDLDAAQVSRLDAASAFDRGVPHEMVEHPASRAKLFADVYDRFDLPGRGPE